MLADYFITSSDSTLNWREASTYFDGGTFSKVSESYSGVQTSCNDPFKYLVTVYLSITINCGNLLQILSRNKLLSAQWY